MRAELDAELIRSVEEVLRSECPLGVVRAAGADAERWRPLWDSATGLGWQALGVPEAAGGLGLGLAAEVALVERAGAALFPAPLLSTVLATAMLRGLLTGGAEDAVTAALERIAGGAAATLAVTDAAGARATWTGATVTGVKADVTDVSRAELVVLTAADSGGGVTAGLVTPDNAAVGVRPNVDPTRPLGEVRLDAAPVAPLGRGVAYGRCAAAVLVAAELVGVAARALDLAVAHARDRVQFGRPIGAFQGVKHRLADTYVATERARSLVGAAADELDRDGTAGGNGRGVPASVAMAKAAASEAALFATRGAIQVAGALGITAEYDLVHLLRRAQQGAHLFGGPRDHYAAVGRTLLDRARTEAGEGTR